MLSLMVDAMAFAWYPQKKSYKWNVVALLFWLIFFFGEEIDCFVGCSVTELKYDYNRMINI